MSPNALCSQSNVGPEGYDAWRRGRLAERRGADEKPQASREVWHHLLTVVVTGETAADAAALPTTLSALESQTYRNIEVLIAGPLAGAVPAGHALHTLRGLHCEPGLDPIDVLADSACDDLWRGDLVMLVRAGTTFDSDAFALINAAANRAHGVAAPAMILTDHDRRDDWGNYTAPILMPGWDPDLIQSLDYIGGAALIARELIEAARGLERPASMHAWLAGVGRLMPPPHVVHLPEPLIHLPPHAPRSAQRPALIRSGGLRLDSSKPASMAIVIPNRNQPELLARCLDMLRRPLEFRAEVVIVDNASDDPRTHAIYQDAVSHLGARVVAMDQAFNFSRMINLGVAATSADVVLLLNNDIEVTAPGQLEQVLAHAMRPEVGAVGSVLTYPDGKVQHAGMLLGPGRHPGHPVHATHLLRGADPATGGYLGELSAVRNYQAVTGALLATRRAVFEAAGGFDEVLLPVEYNDVDYCLKVRKAGLRVINLPLRGILHRESASRGLHETPAVTQMRRQATMTMATRWSAEFSADPFRHPWVDMDETAEPRFPWTPCRGVPGSGTST